MTTPAVDPNWTHPGTVVRVIDGDTLVIRLDLGRYPHRVQTEVPIRLAGAYAPEMREPGGPETRDHVLELLRSTGLTEPYRAVTVRTRKPNPSDPYGRVVADVWADDGTNIGEAVAAFVAEHGYGRGRGASAA